MGARWLRKVCRCVVMLALVLVLVALSLEAARQIASTPAARRAQRALGLQAARRPTATAATAANNRSVERDWACMQHFAHMQERHPFTANSWATPPPDTRSWLRRWLWPLQASRLPTVHAMGDDRRSGGSPRPRVVIAGIAKDIAADHWGFAIPKLVRLAQEAFADYHIVVYHVDTVVLPPYENDSPAVSRHALCDELAQVPAGKASFLFEDLLPGSEQGRTQNIARARNVVLDWVEAHTSGFDYLLVTDLDGVCGGSDPTRSYDTRVLRQAFARSAEWDAVSFVFEPYWDMWAFRHPLVHPFDQFGPHNKDNRIRDMDSLTAWFREQPPDQFVAVDSAFMMLAIYKMDVIGGCRYAGRESRRRGRHGHHSSGPSLIARLLGGGGYAGRPSTCEHVPFHDCIAHEQHGRLRVWPHVFCEGDVGWVNETTGLRVERKRPVAAG